jgi:hypothetical protein
MVNVNIVLYLPESHRKCATSSLIPCRIPLGNVTPCLVTIRNTIGRCDTLFFHRWDNMTPCLVPSIITWGNVKPCFDPVLYISEYHGECGTLFQTYQNTIKKCDSLSHTFWNTMAKCNTLLCTYTRILFWMRSMFCTCRSPLVKSDSWQKTICIILSSSQRSILYLQKTMAKKTLHMSPVNHLIYAASVPELCR